MNEILPERPNLLLVIVDDLKPALGVYGDVDAFTPNLDHLAEKEGQTAQPDY
jgi:iduronate 2-sulfatase